MKITGTFITDSFTDIPDQNWSIEQWDADYRAMKQIGIDTVILLRCGIEKFQTGGGWITYPSKVLEKYCPALLRLPEDWIEMHLSLAQKYGIKCFVGVYRQFEGFREPGQRKVIDLGRKVIDELWDYYSRFTSFAGWYLPFEISRAYQPLDAFKVLGKHCHDISGGLPVMISPGNDGIKNVSVYESQTRKAELDLTFEQHQHEWKQMMPEIAGAIDIIAFQDGHVDLEELGAYTEFNSSLARKYGVEFWSNAETFDRDMPIKFLPIAWYKLFHKLRIAETAGAAKAITFEFSHFLSPNSSYPQARSLFHKYCAQFGITMD
jgi:hypothetical protein